MACAAAAFIGAEDCGGREAFGGVGAGEPGVGEAVKLFEIAGGIKIAGEQAQLESGDDTPGPGDGIVGSDAGERRVSRGCSTGAKPFSRGPSIALLARQRRPQPHDSHPHTMSEIADDLSPAGGVPCEPVLPAY